MFVAHFENTMRGAKFKGVDPEFDAKPAVKTTAEIRAEKLAVLVAKRQHEFDSLQANLAEVRERWARQSSGDLVGVAARDIAAGVAALHGYTLAEIVGKRQNKEIIAARHDAIKAVADARPDMSLPQVGKIFHRDHTSILHALRKRGGRQIKG